VVMGNVGAGEQKFVVNLTQLTVPVKAVISVSVPSGMATQTDSTIHIICNKKTNLSEDADGERMHN
jgi:hypothetical protein